MQSTFTGLEIGKRSLIAHNKGLTTVGHNITNASTEGYSRQRVKMETFDPLYAPALNRENTPGQIGQGVAAVSVERIKDELLEGRIVSQNNMKGYWANRDKYILMTEQIYNEPGEYSVRSMMDRFWESWQDLSIHPSESASRQSVLQRGEALIAGIHQRYNSLRETRDMADSDVAATVYQINSILSDVSSLNEKIVKIKAMGDNPNDLLDRRDLLVNRLSSMINITVENRDPDEFQIHTGGLHLIQGRAVNYLSTDIDPVNEGYSRVVWDKTGEEAFFKGGSLASLLELRDNDLRDEIQKLDLMTVNFIDNVNNLHRKGWGQNRSTGLDFFKEYPFVTSVEGNYDRNGDGEFDSTYIFRVSGTNKLNPEALVGIRGQLTLSGRDGDVNIDYYPTDTVTDVIDRINNSPAEVNAVLDDENRLTIRAMTSKNIDNPDFAIRHLEDSGEFLGGYSGILQNSGPEGAFDWERAGSSAVFVQGDLNAEYAVAPLSHPSGWIEVNRAVKEDPMSIAAGFGENGRAANPGDGSAALAIASLRNKPLMLGKFSSFDEYFSRTVADIALKGEEAETSLETQTLIMKELEDLKQSISGVNIDEELSQMIKFQHGYAAAARFISEVNDMLDTIINRMGV